MNVSAPVAPRGDGEFFFDRDPGLWKKEAEVWRGSSLDRKTFGLTSREVRREVLWPEAPTVLSAHQPVLFHPGLWAKPLAASVLAASWGWCAVHKITDQDAPGDADGWMPSDASEGWAPQALRWTQPHRPYAFQPAPLETLLEGSLQKALASPWPSVREAAVSFSPRLQAFRKTSADWDDWHLGCLRMLDEECGTERIYGRASLFWETVSFRRFLSLWFKEAGRFADATNRALQDYRSAHGITHPLTPVPNLMEEEGWREMPFWAVSSETGRSTLWVKTGVEEVLLRASGTKESWGWSLSSGPEGLAKAPWRLWPKALPQSLYTRLFLADFFLHGLGGGFYEPVNDRFLGVLGEGPAAPFGVVSATLLPERARSRELETLATRWERWEHWRRSFEKNPEYLFSRADQWAVELPPEALATCREATATEGFEAAVCEKGEWLRSLQDPARRSEAGRRLKEWNAHWVSRLAPFYKALDASQNVWEGLRGEREALSFREYAFLCYPPARWKHFQETLDRKIRREEG